MEGPLEPETSHRPQVGKLQYDRIKSYLAIGRKGGKSTMGGDAGDGYFIKPTAFESLPEDSRVVKEEVFGPVVVINTFKAEAEAIAKANDNEHGLYVAIFTKDLDRAVRVSKLLQAGAVGVNYANPNFARDMPYGGYKMKDIGRREEMNSLNYFLG